jgi:hypothetical protein
MEPELEQCTFRLHRGDWPTPLYTQLREWFAPGFARFLSKSRALPPKDSSTCFCALVIHEVRRFLCPYNIGECPQSCWKWQYELRRIFAAKAVKMTQHKILDEMSLFGNSHAYERYIKNRPLSSWISHITETIIWGDPETSNGPQTAFPSTMNISSLFGGWKHRVDFTPGIRQLPYLQIKSMVSPHGTDDDPSERSDKSLDVVRTLEVPDESESRSPSPDLPSVEGDARSFPAPPGPDDDLQPLTTPLGPESRRRASLTSSTTLLTDLTADVPEPLFSGQGQDNPSQQTPASSDSSDNSRKSFAWLPIEIRNNSRPPRSEPGEGSNTQTSLVPSGSGLDDDTLPTLSTPGQGDRPPPVAPPVLEDSSQSLLASPDADDDSQPQSSATRRQESGIHPSGFGPNNERIFTLPRAPGATATDRVNAAYSRIVPQQQAPQAAAPNYSRLLPQQQEAEGPAPNHSNTAYNRWAGLSDRAWHRNQERKARKPKWLRRIRRWFKRITRPRKTTRTNPTNPSAPRSSGSQNEAIQPNPTDIFPLARTSDEGDTMRTLSVAVVQADGVSDDVGERITNVAGENSGTKAADENSAGAPDRGAQESVVEECPDADVGSIETRATARSDFVPVAHPAVWRTDTPGRGNPFISLHARNIAETSIDAGVGSSGTRAAEGRRDASVERPTTSRGRSPPRHGSPFLGRHTRGVEGTADDPVWIETSSYENSTDAGVEDSPTRAAVRRRNTLTERPAMWRDSLPRHRNSHRSPFVDQPEPWGVKLASNDADRVETSSSGNSADAGVGVTEPNAAEEVTDSIRRSIERSPTRIERSLESIERSPAGIERSPAAEITDVPNESLVLWQAPSIHSVAGVIDYTNASVRVTETSDAEQITNAAAGESVESNSAEEPVNLPNRRLLLPQTPNFGGFAESIALSGFSFVTNIETSSTETTTTEDTSVEAETAANEIINDLLDDSAIDGANKISGAIAIATPDEEQLNETRPARPRVRFRLPTPRNAPSVSSVTTLDDLEARLADIETMFYNAAIEWREHADDNAERESEPTDDNAGRDSEDADDNAERVHEHVDDNVDVSANDSATSSSRENSDDQSNASLLQSTASRSQEHFDANEARSVGSDAGNRMFVSSLALGNPNDDNSSPSPPRTQLERFRRVWGRHDKRPFSLAWIRKKIHPAGNYGLPRI